MPTFEVKSPDGKTYTVNAPDGATEADAIAYVQSNLHGTGKNSVIGGDAPQASGLENAIKGQLSAAGNVASSLMYPVNAGLHALGLMDNSPSQQRAATQDMLTSGADKNSATFKTAKLIGDIEATAPVGSVLAKAASAIPALAKFAPAIQSGGFNLGNAATGSRIANGALRVGAGALTNGVSGGLLNPDNAVESAVIGGIIPGSVAAGGLAGDAINNGANALSRYLMQSALKPPKGAVLKGTADNAINAMLENGINVTDGGLGKTQSLINDLNSQIKNLIQGSNATIDKGSILPYLNDVKSNAALTPSHVQDLNSIANIEDGFLTMPSAQGNSIPVSTAQDIKQAIYKRLKDSYGQIGSAETEANKAIARGLKDNIVSSVPEVAPLNARESGLIDAQKLLANRLAVSGNKDPMGLAALVMSDPKAAAAFMLNRSEIIKSLGARGVYNAGNAIGKGLQALPSPIQQYGLLGAPAALTSSP